MKIDRYWAGIRLGSAKIWPSRSGGPRKGTKNWRWAAEPPGEQPYGPHPYELKQAQALASAVIAATIRITEAQSLRDLLAHLRERGRESGATFQDGHSSVAEHARGIQWAITDEFERYRRHDQLRWFIDGFVDDGNLSAKEEADDWESNIPHGTDSQIAAFAGFEFQELDNAIEDRRARYGRPLRPRQKPGRKPNGECAMTNSERVRNHRARKKPTKAAC